MPQVNKIQNKPRMPLLSPPPIPVLAYEAKAQSKGWVKASLNKKFGKEVETGLH